VGGEGAGVTWLGTATFAPDGGARGARAGGRAPRAAAPDGASCPTAERGDAAAVDGRAAARGCGAVSGAAPRTPQSPVPQRQCAVAAPAAAVAAAAALAAAVAAPTAAAAATPSC